MLPGVRKPPPAAAPSTVGRSGRGYCRQKTIFDLSNGSPRIVFHQDLTAYGWALGQQVRQWLRETKANRT